MDPTPAHINVAQRVFKLWWTFAGRSSFGRTYILPTKYGIYFGLGDLVILALAFVYANNAIYFLAFFVFSMVLVTMVITNYNLARIEIRNWEIRSFFADEMGNVKVEISNPGRNPVYALRLFFRNGSEPPVEVEKVDGGESIKVEIPLRVLRRGRQALPRLIVETRFPFGFFRSWRTLQTEDFVIVYPARKGLRILPTQLGDLGREAIRENDRKISREEVFAGHRNYQNADSFRRIDWKAYARTQELLLKQYEGEESGEEVDDVILQWQHTEALGDLETRVSQLALWSEICHQRRGKFQLVVPGWSSSLNRGENHLRVILEYLSVFEGEREHHA